MIEKNDDYFMRKAFALGLEAFKQGEVPIGAVIVKDGIVIGENIFHHYQKGSSQNYLNT